MKKNLLVATLVCALGIFSIAQNNFAQARNTQATKSFTLADIQGKQVALADFKDRPVLLFFWTTWCPHCRMALKGLEERKDEMKKSGVEVLLIDVGEELGYINKFVKKNNITYPVLLDTTSSVALSYDVIGVPTFVLMNKSGEVVFTAHNFPAGYVELISK